MRSIRFIRSGKLPMDLPRPFIVGCDLAGIVEAAARVADPQRPTDGKH
jgi:NADPH:quinone reductase-like Zn-dependent oxidoreductase